MLRCHRLRRAPEPRAAAGTTMRSLRFVEDAQYNYGRMTPGPGQQLAARGHERGTRGAASGEASISVSSVIAVILASALRTHGAAKVPHSPVTHGRQVVLMPRTGFVTPPRGGHRQRLNRAHRLLSAQPYLEGALVPDCCSRGGHTMRSDMRGTAVSIGLPTHA